MIIKVFKQLLFGFIGIIINDNINFYIKALLLYDYVNLILFTAGLSIFFREQLNKEKSFYIKSFKYKIHFKNICSFLFLFTEIFCKAEYGVKTNVKRYVDLGSNIGLSILWYYHFNPKISVLGFEPDKDSIFFLNKNLRENHMSDYKIHSIALSDKRSKAKFYKLEDIIQNLDSGLYLNQKIKHTVTQVQTDKLSVYIKNIPISLMKIDIEGSEYSVFRELISANCLSKVDEIVFESHHLNQKQIEEYEETIFSLKKLGYIISLNSSKVTKINHWYNKKIKI